MKQEYALIRVWKDTAQKLKLLAAMLQKSMIETLTILVDAALAEQNRKG